MNILLLLLIVLIFCGGFGYGGYSYGGPVLAGGGVGTTLAIVLLLYLLGLLR